MSFASMLVDTCTVKRFGDLGPDDYGRPIKDWPDHLVDEPCRLASAGGREVQVGAEVVVADYRLFIADVDITEQDRVEVAGTLYEILLVEPRSDGLGAHHKELLLRLVR